MSITLPEATRTAVLEHLARARDAIATAHPAGDGLIKAFLAASAGVDQLAVDLIAAVVADRNALSAKISPDVVLNAQVWEFRAEISAVCDSLQSMIEDAAPAASEVPVQPTGSR